MNIKRVAVINEVSAADKNSGIVAALKKSGVEVINAGMRNKDMLPSLQYTHTGFLSAILLNLGIVDYVVGGCGTGQGYLNSVMQYPGVFCGHIVTSLDAWLFTQINGGNCISLQLNQGYGWAGDVNLDFIFERLFSVETGCGYPANRKEPQKESRKKLEDISSISHKSMAEIVIGMPSDIIDPVLEFPGIKELLSGASKSDLLGALESRNKNRKSFLVH